MRRAFLTVSILALFLIASGSQANTAVDPGASLRAIPSASGGFSVYFPVITRAQGATTVFYTSLDITNNHAASATDVDFLYVSADGTIVKSGKLVTLQKLGSYHADDFLQSLADAGVISQAQANGTYGLLLLTFTSSAFTTGAEASAVARVYNYVTGSSGPSIGLAYRAQLLRKNGAHRLVSVISDTDAPESSGIKLLTNMGLVNLGINDAGASVTSAVTLTITFIDPNTGGRVGSQRTITLNPAQLIQINDVFTYFSIPSTMKSLTVLVEGPADSTAPQIDGYVVLKDVSSNDGSYFSMQTASSVTTAPEPPPPAGTTVQRLYLSPLLNFKLNVNPTARSSALEWCVSSTSWDTAIAGDIAGSAYKFNLAVKTANGSTGSGSMRADIVHRSGSTETVLATTTLTTSTQYEVKNVSVTGIDPTSRDGDTLLLRVTRISGDPCVAEFISAGDVNYIDIPPTPVR